MDSTNAKRTIAHTSNVFGAFRAVALVTSRNRRAVSPHPLYALLDDSTRKHTLSFVWSLRHRGRPVPPEEAGAKHRAAWRSHAAANSQKIFRGL